MVKVVIVMEGVSKSSGVSEKRVGRELREGDTAKVERSTLHLLQKTSIFFIFAHIIERKSLKWIQAKYDDWIIFQTYTEFEKISSILGTFLHFLHFVSPPYD